MGSGPRLAVVGAGNGGLATAGDLVLRGHEVKGLFSADRRYIEPVLERGGIEVQGDLQAGFARIETATDDLGQAVRDADAILVVVPAYGQRWVAEHLAPHLRDGQIVVLCPGYLGTLEVSHLWKQMGLKARVYIAELQSLFFGTRIVGPAQVRIMNIRNRLPIAALPASDTAHVLSVLQPVFPQLIPGANVLEVGFTNINIPEHVPLCVLNFARWEKEGGTADIPNWKTDPVLKLAKMVDQERQAVARAYGVNDASLEELRRGAYQGGTRKEMKQQAGPVLETAGVLPPRYITEDVPLGYVALSQLAKVAGVPMPAVDTLTNLCSLLYDTDFHAQGRNLEKMGLAGMSMEQIKTFVS